MATADHAPGDRAMKPATSLDPDVLAKLEREWEQVMEIARTGDERERERAFSAFAKKRRALGVGPLPAPSEIIIREDRDSDHGRLWPLD